LKYQYSLEVKVHNCTGMKSGNEPLVMNECHK